MKTGRLSWGSHRLTKDTLAVDLILWYLIVVDFCREASLSCLLNKGIVLTINAQMFFTAVFAHKEENLSMKIPLFRFTFFLLVYLALPLTATGQVVSIPEPVSAPVCGP